MGKNEEASEEGQSPVHVHHNYNTARANEKKSVGTAKLLLLLNDPVQCKPCAVAR